MNPFDIHTRLISLLNQNEARYELIKHPPEGRSQEISRIRGNHPSQAMKAIVLSVRGGGKRKRTIMAIIPGDQRLEMKALLAYVGAQKGRFTEPEEASRLTGCVMGAIPPFTFRPDLPLVIDQSFKDCKVVAFNAGRLDRSIMLNFNDYVRIVNPAFSSLTQVLT